MQQQQPEPARASGDTGAPGDDGLDAQSDEAFRRGSLLASVGRHADAVPYLARAVELHPESAEARYRLGLSCVLSGDRSTAIAQKAALEEIDPNLANLLANLIR